jgi:PD-(D/E)XK nuclease superfamily
MKKMEYLSPTSIALFLEDQQAFYLNYLADERPPKDPQTEPMAVGSAFDAFVKHYLYTNVVGKSDPRFDRLALFEAQVEVQCRDKAFKAGEYCFEQYKKSGCLADLMLELQQSIGEPRFEINIMGQVDGYREGAELDLGPVPFLGKPDVYFVNKMGARVIVDWKVNGFYSKYNTSPIKGYVRMRDAFQSYGQHKECMQQVWKGMRINIGCYLDQLKEDWARQLAIYTWLCGENVGTEDCIVGLDQLVCNPDPVRQFPKIRIAEHRLRISKAFQHKVFAIAQDLWHRCTKGHFFREMSKEASDERCLYLDKYMTNTKKPVVDNDDWFNRQVR